MTDFLDELPPDARQKGPRGPRLTRFAAELRDNPGRWAKYPRALANDNSRRMTASLIRNGRTASFPGAPWEAEVRDEDLYVRYAPKVGSSNGSQALPFDPGGQ